LLYGYSPWPAERIATALDGGTAAVDLPGDFTAVSEGVLDGKPWVRIATSMVAARPYFWARGPGGRLVHGASVFDVLRRAALPWQWNHRAVTFLALLGHTVGEDSLHPLVFRVPCAAVITGIGDTIKIDRRQDETWRSVFEQPSVSPDAAIACLREVFGEMARSEGVVSLSAGFDSRLLLALALANQQRPRALTVGFSDSTDLKVAKTIATELGLEHHVVELKSADYLDHARSIVTTTSGTKMAGHWHTDLYVRNANLESDFVHYVGSNGEFARSYYFDKGMVSRSLGKGPLPVFTAFMAAKVARRARLFPAALLRAGPGPLACAREATRLAGLHGTRFGDTLDYFYATQRVRHFIGNGLALYSQHCSPRSPFLDSRWIRAIAGLDRSERLGSNFHRRAIAATAPQLLRFPVEAGGEMDQRARRLYYLRKSRSVGFGAFDGVLRDPRVGEIIAESKGLDELMSKPERVAAVAAGGPVVELLLTLAFAAELGRT
jgi:hypothetical protein